jgi:SAM-dependent methyltransferase
LISHNVARYIPHRAAEAYRALTKSFIITLSAGAYRALTKSFRRNIGAEQDLHAYFDPNFANILEAWADDTAWPEIQFLLSSRTGKALDLACGTGGAFNFLKQFHNLEYHGCDISALLIERAVAKGIPRDRLRVTDATQLDYPDRSFDYVFSIGSLEHFTEEGVAAAISECHRVCQSINFHHVPVSRSGFNEGWIVERQQSYWNNSEQWWLDRFRKTFGDNVWVMSSKFSDVRYRGAWFICVRQDWQA